MQTHSKTFNITAAGRRYLTFLSVFNSGDTEQMERYLERQFDPFSFDVSFTETFLDWYRNAYAETGGLRIHRVYLAQEHYVIVIVKGELDGTMYLDKMAVTEEDPWLITEYDHTPQPN